MSIYWYPNNVYKLISNECLYILISNEGYNGMFNLYFSKNHKIYNLQYCKTSYFSRTFAGSEFLQTRVMTPDIQIRRREDEVFLRIACYRRMEDVAILKIVFYRRRMDWAIQRIVCSQRTLSEDIWMFPWTMVS